MSSSTHNNKGGSHVPINPLQFQVQVLNEFTRFIFLVVQKKRDLIVKQSNNVS